MNLHCILQQLTDAVLDESIQAMIKDMQLTQHGDRTNRMYDLLSDFHMEGGLWKHTKLAIDALPEVAEVLGVTDVYEKHKNTLRAAALYHDIGKIATAKPSGTKPGVSTFPQHDTRAVIQQAFQLYDVSPSVEVLDLVANHHASEKDLQQLKQAGWSTEKLQILLILKAANLKATGPRGAVSAVAGLAPFKAAIDEPVAKKQQLPWLRDWSIEDVDWAPGSRQGFGKEKIVSGHFVPPEDASGSGSLDIEVSAPHYKGRFEAECKAYLAAKPSALTRVTEFFGKEALLFLADQGYFPEEARELEFGSEDYPIEVELDVEHSFKVLDQTDPMIFVVRLSVAWFNERVPKGDVDTDE